MQKKCALYLMHNLCHLGVTLVEYTVYKTIDVLNKLRGSKKKAVHFTLRNNFHSWQSKLLQEYNVIEGFSSSCCSSTYAQKERGIMNFQQIFSKSSCSNRLFRDSMQLQAFQSMDVNLHPAALHNTVGLDRYLDELLLTCL